MPLEERFDFANFVLGMGSRQNHLSGGTYGFGKTVTYTASLADTVIMSSRTTHHGVEQRFIASAMGSSYTFNERRFTGRHWWGRVVEDRPEPITGTDAEALHAELFSRPFNDDELGTSLLIVDVNLTAGEDDSRGSGDSNASSAPISDSRAPREYADRLAKAVLWHLWPKMISSPDRPTMKITVLLEGEEIPIPDPEAHPIIKHFVASLRAVRATQGRAGERRGFTTQVEPMVDGRGKGTLIGHLAVTHVVGAAGSDRFGLDSDSCHHYCLMRNDAELVVRYVSGPPRADEVQWAGVFKPVAQFDQAFANSEPPAHDDWLPKSVLDKTERSRVNVAFTKISSFLKEWSNPKNPVIHSPGEGRSTAALADALRALVLGAPGNRPTTAPARVGATKSRPRNLTTRVRDSALLPRHDGWQEWSLLVECAGPPGARARFTAVAQISTAAGNEDVSDECVVRGWDPAEGSLSLAPLTPGDSIELGDGELARLRVAAVPGVSVAVTINRDES
ncbi:hypothetical protein CGZ92_03930 [Parenemella sanctibonifatiensis]|uniref:Uncharacterized protein n=1 Tax=Parenemella sanctibonifatiensis TaxID=2016505 RepID=A0A255EC70_9ACTN|nr:hypothetical protein CGZ92_03930 [Parenemella sanctibonifatiensis]